MSNPPVSQLKSAGVPNVELMVMTFGNGDKLDISPQMVCLILNEDIFAPVLSGKIILKDGLGLFDNMAISGNETLTVKFYSYDFDPLSDPVTFIHRTFDILKISNIDTLPNDYTKTYELSFASPELKKSEMVRISRAYQNKRISEIVESLMTDIYEVDYTVTPPQSPLGLDFPKDPPLDGPYGGENSYLPLLDSDNLEAQYQNVNKDNAVELYIEKTKGVDPWTTLPYMKPLTAIKWLAAKSFRNQETINPAALDGNKHNSVNFLFYENRRGFQFLSLDSLLEERASEQVPTFYYGNAVQNIERAWNAFSIDKIKIENCYDVLSNIKEGIYSSQLTTYEWSTGEVKTLNYDFLKDGFYSNLSMDRNYKTEDYPQIKLDENGKNPITQKPLSKRMFMPSAEVRDGDPITSNQTWRYNTETTTPLVGAETYVQDRMSQLAKLSDFRVLIEIPANSTLQVGDIITLYINSWTMDDGMTIKQIKNKYYNGNYLITNIRHILTNTSYTMQIELAKDSLTAKIG